ncbi:MAG: hypothetical protein ACPGN3_16700 [Opitutales bacterium]
MIEAKSLVEATSDFHNELEQLCGGIRNAFEARDFDFLEDSALKFIESKALLDDGSWSITRFHEALGRRPGRSEPQFQADLQILKEWETEFPNSLTAKVAKIDFLTDYAWFARGGGYSNTVTDEGWKLMGERLMEAWKIIQTAVDHEGKNPYLYEIAIKVAMGLSVDARIYSELLTMSRENFPGYYPIEVRRAYSLLPRWHGSEGDWEHFADEASDAAGDLGPEVYARIIMNQKRFYGDVFRDSAVEWEKAKVGLLSLNKKYPEAVEIQNFTAFLAVQGRDRELASEYFDKLGDQYVKKVWSKPERFVHYRTWAKTGRW